MTTEAKFAKSGVEEETPLAVVVLVHVEGDGNVVTNGDRLDDRGGGGRGERAIVGG